MSLDQWLPPSASKPAQSEIFTQERCANPKCRKPLKITDVKYTLTIKGEKSVYCPACAKKILHPREDMEASL